MSNLANHVRPWAKNQGFRVIKGMHLFRFLVLKSTIFLNESIFKVGTIFRKSASETNRLL